MKPGIDACAWRRTAASSSVAPLITSMKTAISSSSPTCPPIRTPATPPTPPLRRYGHGSDRAHAGLPGQQCLDIEGRYVLAAHTAQAAHAVDEGVGVGSLGDLA